MRASAEAPVEAARPGSVMPAAAAHRVGRLPWLLVLLSSAGLVLYGALAASGPPDTASYILWLYRLVGGLSIALGITLVAVALGPARRGERGERWAWWTLLAGSLIGYGAPMTYDQIVGHIGGFEIVEYVAVAAVLLAFVLSRRGPTSAPPPATQVSPSAVERS